MLASKKTRAENRMYGIGTGIRSSSRNAGNADLLFDRDSRPASSESEKRTDGVHNCSIILAAWAKLVAGSRTIAVLRTMCNCTSKVRYVVGARRIWISVRAPRMKLRLLIAHTKLPASLVFNWALCRVLRVGEVCLQWVPSDVPAKPSEQTSEDMSSLVVSLCISCTVPRWVMRESRLHCFIPH